MGRTNRDALRRGLATAQPVTKARVLALVTDAYGGTGGIAAYARDTIAAIASDPRVGQVVVVPRRIDRPLEPIPDKVLFYERAAQGTAAYLRRGAIHIAQGGFDAVWAAHVHLAPLAWLAARRSGARWGLTLHGSEAWPGATRRGVAGFAPRADLLMPVSQLTLDRWRSAMGSRQGPAQILPGTVDLDRFAPGARPDALARRLGVSGRPVLLTLGRLNAQERTKGFDRVIALLPRLRRRWPDIAYVIGGDGDDRPRLEQLARELGVADRVIFTGFVAEEDKVDLYRLADAYVMPSVGEGLGIVFLEAMACGIPTVASDIDGGREAVSGMGWAVDPHDPAALEAAIGEALAAPNGRPSGIDHFARPAFDARMREALGALLGD